MSKPLGIFPATYKIELSGDITNSSCQVVYKKIKENAGGYNALTNLSADMNIPCLSYLSENSSKIRIFSENAEAGFAMELSRI